MNIQQIKNIVKAAFLLVDSLVNPAAGEAYVTWMDRVEADCKEGQEKAEKLAEARKAWIASDAE